MAISPSTPTTAPNTWVYVAAVLAIVIWGATPAATETAVRTVDLAAVGMLRTIIAAAILLPTALLLRFPLPADRSGWLAVAYLAIFASILGYAAWYWAIDKAGVARIAPIQFAQPLVRLILAVLLLSEPMTIRGYADWTNLPMLDRYYSMQKLVQS